jgi:hypothetical protein
MIDIAVDGKGAVYSLRAGEIYDTSLGLILYTEKKPNAATWDRRGVVDSFYIDPRAKLVSIGVDQRDIIDVPIEQEILLMPVRNAT